jgi:hypothetical protein
MKKRIFKMLQSQTLNALGNMGIENLPGNLQLNGSTDDPITQEYIK